MHKNLVANENVRLRDIHLRISNNLQLISAVLRLRRKQAATPHVQAELMYIERVLRYVSKKCEDKDEALWLGNDQESRLRSLWNQLEGNFDLLLSILLVREKQHSDRIVRAELRRMQHLVSIVAELQESPRNEEPLDFATYVDGVVNLWNKLAWENGVRIENDRIGPVLICSELATLLGVALFETLSNSIEHGYPGGGPGRVFIGLRKNGGNTACLRITDDGIGFDPPANDGGGSGLSIVRRLVRSIGGTMCVRSRLGRGTETAIGFPLVGSQET